MQPWYKEAAASPEFAVFVLGLAFFFGIFAGLGARRFPVRTSAFLGAVASSVWWIFLQDEIRTLLSFLLAWSLFCLLPPYAGALIGQRLKRRLNWA